MTTDRQANANRRNAKRSTGPSSAEGKHVASRNALRHGGYAATNAIARGPWFEEPDALGRHIAGIVASLNPQNGAQRCVAQMIAETFVRSDRIASFEASVLASASGHDALDHAGQLTDLYRHLALGARCVSEVVQHGVDWIPADEDAALVSAALLHAAGFVEDEPENPEDPWAAVGHPGVHIRDTLMDRSTACELIWAVMRKEYGSDESAKVGVAREAAKRERTYADAIVAARAMTAAHCLEIITIVAMDASDRNSRQLLRYINAYRQLRNSPRPSKSMIRETNPIRTRSSRATTTTKARTLRSGPSY